MFANSSFCAAASPRLAVSKSSCNCLPPCQSWCGLADAGTVAKAVIAKAAPTRFGSWSLSVFVEFAMRRWWTSPELDGRTFRRWSQIGYQGSACLTIWRLFASPLPECVRERHGAVSDVGDRRRDTQDRPDRGNSDEASNRRMSICRSRGPMALIIRSWSVNSASAGAEEGGVCAGDPERATTRSH